MGSLRKVRKGYKNKERWDSPLKEFMFDYPEARPTRVRLWEELFTIPMHYVSFIAKDKSKKGFYAQCLNWDYDAEEQADCKCPYCEEGISATPYSYGLVIKRSEQKKGNLQPLVIRMTPTLVYKIGDLTADAYPDDEWPDGFEEDPEEPGVGPDATDRKYGFDLLVKVSKSGKKTEYSASIPPQNGILPLKKDEIRAFKDFVGQYDFLAMAKATLPTVADVRKDLERLGIAKSSKHDDDLDGDEFDMDDDDDGDLPRQKKKRPSKGKKEKTRKVQSISDADDDDFDDDDDEPSRSYAHGDEEDAPDDDDDEFDEFDD